MEPTNELDSTNKTCTKCKQEQPVAAFFRNKSKKDGLQSQCKKCDKAYHEANPEKRKAWDKAYCEANPDKVKASKKAYREDNKEECAARQKAWREANPGKKAASGKAWREDNKEKCAASGKAWREDNPELCEMRAVIRRANRGDIPSLKIYGLPDRESVKQVRTDKLAIFRKFFGKGKYHLDHMRPLAEVKGDTEELHKRSHFSNLVYIPAKVNLSKNAKPFWEWFATLKDQKLKKCIALQDAYNKAIERAIAC